MLEFRSAPTEPVLKLTWDEFERMVRRGQVAATDLVRARVITGDDWWTADNLAVFHRNSPVKHPYGQHLAGEVEAKRRRAGVDAMERLAEFDYQRARNFLDAHRLSPLHLLVTELGAPAASRLIVSPSFGYNRIVTCLYTGSELRVEVIIPSVGNWTTHLQCPLTDDGQWTSCPRMPLPVVSARKATAVIEARRAPKLLRSPGAIVAAAKVAPPCRTMTLDGVGYDHFVMTPIELLFAHWSNPQGQEYEVQLALVEAYERLLAVAGLDGEPAC